jgi:hypothetical protein
MYYFGLGVVGSVGFEYGGMILNSSINKMNNVKIPYSKSPMWLIIAIAFVGLLINKANIINFFSSQKAFMNILVLAAAAVLIILIVVFGIKFYKKTAIELNQQGIIDYTRNTVVYWKDIKSIHYAMGKTSANIIVELLDESTFRIYLSFVKGNDESIYKEIIKYFEESKKSN